MSMKVLHWGLRECLACPHNIRFPRNPSLPKCWLPRCPTRRYAIHNMLSDFVTVSAVRFLVSSHRNGFFMLYLHIVLHLDSIWHTFVLPRFSLSLSHIWVFCCCFIITKGMEHFASSCLETRTEGTCTVNTTVITDPGAFSALSNSGACCFLRFQTRAYFMFWACVYTYIYTFICMYICIYILHRSCVNVYILYKYVNMR